MTKTQGVSVIIAVMDEAGNIRPLLDGFYKVRKELLELGVDELIFVVDESTDGTATRIRDYGSIGSDINIKIFERAKRKGLVNAQLFGCRKAANNVVVIMDGDLQHPVEFLPKLVSSLDGNSDVVVASRRVSGGTTTWSPFRGVVSRVAAAISWVFIPSSRKLKDTTSGFLVARRDIISDLKPVENRTKILLYLLSIHREIRIKEVPYSMGSRICGSSKLVDKSFHFFVSYFIEIIDYAKKYERGHRLSTVKRDAHNVERY